MSDATTTDLAAVLSHAVIGYALDRPEEPAGNALDAGLAAVRDAIYDDLLDAVESGYPGAPHAGDAFANDVVGLWLRDLKGGAL